jgi:hypothetical protein
VVARSHAIATEAEHTAQDAAEQQGVGLLWCALGVVELATPDVAAARGSFTRARRYLREARPEFSGRARAWLALAEAVYGDLAAAGDLLAAPDLAAAGDPASASEFAGDPTAAGDQDSRPAVDALTGRLAGLAAAYVHLTRDEPAAARAALDRCEPGQAGQAGGGQDAAPDPMTAQVLFALVSAARVRLALAEGDLGAARAFVNRLRYQSLNAGQGLYQGRSPDTGGSPALERFLAPLEAEIALRDGDHNRARLALAQAAQASRAGPDSEAVPGGSAGSGLLLAQARLQIAQGDNGAALSTVRPCLAAATGGVSQLTLQDRVGAMVTAAIAARRLGQAELAAGRLTDALNLAEPQGMYRPFLDGGPDRADQAGQPGGRVRGPGAAAVRAGPLGPGGRRRGPADQQRACRVAVPAVAYDQPGDRRRAVLVHQHGQDASALGLPQARRDDQAAGDRARQSARAALAPAAADGLAAVAPTGDGRVQWTDHAALRTYS